MPGFIIHLAEATMIMEYMKTIPDADWRQEFLLGALLPDTRLGNDKAESHFWQDGYEPYIARAPKLSLFLEKYGHRLNEPVILGYYAHLFLDERYVRSFWPKTLNFEDSEGCTVAKKQDICQVELKRTKEKIPFDQFFSSDYYYGDYTKCNHWFVAHYHLRRPEMKDLGDVQIDEADVDRLNFVLEEIDYLCEHSHSGDEKKMRVFDLIEIETFVRKTAEAFCTHMEHLLQI